MSKIKTPRSTTWSAGFSIYVEKENSLTRTPDWRTDEGICRTEAPLRHATHADASIETPVHFETGNRVLAFASGFLIWIERLHEQAFKGHE